MIDKHTLIKIGGVDYCDETTYGGIGNLATRSIPNLLSWLLDEEFLIEATSNPTLRGVITTQEIARSLPPQLSVVIHADPMLVVERLIHHQAMLMDRSFPTQIDSSATIHQSAVISPINVQIGEGTIIEANVTIRRNVIIGRNCTIRAGAVVGSDNFSKFRSKSGRICGCASINWVKLDDEVEVGSNTCIDIGDSGKDTTIGFGTKIHSRCQVCHGVSIGREVIVWGDSFICGFARVGDRTQLQPRVLISNHIIVGHDCYIGISSTVTKDVPDGQSYLGVRVLQSKATLHMLNNKRTQ